MKARTPALLLFCLYAAFLGSLYFSRDFLPPSVATHFNGAGAPDNWTSRSSYLFLFAIFGFVFPGFMIGSFFVIRFLPVSALNLPNRDYWTAPERRAETYDRFFRYSLWFGCLSVAFVLGMHLAIVEANMHSHPKLSLGIIMGVAGAFVAGVLAWALALILPFCRIPD